MPEQQHIEFKQSWHDDYLKCLPDAGGDLQFCKRKGGVIYIGKGNNGNVVGIADYKKLRDDIPNKTKMEN